jgi:hypothetical protein
VKDETLADAGVAQAKRMRWDGRARPHYEVWYTTASHLTTGAGFWIRYALLSPRRGAPRVQVWFTSFVPDLAESNVAAAQEYSIEHFSGETAEPWGLRIGPSLLEQGRMTGMLDAAGTPVTWDLVYQPVTDALDLLPKPFYRTRWVSTKVTVPHPFLMIGGKIQIGGRTFILNGDPAQQGHVWGSRHAAEWIWFHCSAFVDDLGESVPGYVTGVTAQPRVAGFVLPPVSFGHVVWKDAHGALRPATPWQSRRDDRWIWSGRLGDDDVTATVTFPWSAMVLARYEDPSGGEVFCHHTERGDCTLQLRAPRQPPRIFRAASSAHLEIGSRKADPRAPRRVMLQR